MTTHPLNCSTCTKFWNPDSDKRGCKNSGSIWNMTKEQVQQISDVGCASHSSNRIMPITNNKMCEMCSKSERADERNKVLDELEKRLSEKQEVIVEGHIPLVWMDDIQDIFKELR